LRPHRSLLKAINCFLHPFLSQKNLSRSAAGANRPTIVALFPCQLEAAPKLVEGFLQITAVTEGIPQPIMQLEQMLDRGCGRKPGTFEVLGKFLDAQAFVGITCCLRRRILLGEWAGHGNVIGSFPSF